MKLRTEIETQDGVLIVTAHGDAAFDAALRLLKEACDAAAAKQLNRILVDCLAMEGEFSTLERYTLGVEVATYIVQRQMNHRLALVGKLPTLDGFGVRVAQNRGLTTEFFSNQQEALNWLSAGSS